MRRVRLGDPYLLARCPVLAARARDVQQAEVRRRMEAVLPYLEQARLAGATILRQIAGALMMHGAPAPRGGQRWHPAQVRLIAAAVRHASYAVADPAKEKHERRRANRGRRGVPGPGQVAGTFRNIEFLPSPFSELGPAHVPQSKQARHGRFDDRVRNSVACLDGHADQQRVRQRSQTFGIGILAQLT